MFALVLDDCYLSLIVLAKWLLQLLRRCCRIHLSIEYCFAVGHGVKPKPVLHESLQEAFPLYSLHILKEVSNASVLQE